MASRPGYNASVHFSFSSILGGSWSALVRCWGFPKNCDESWVGPRRISNLLPERTSARSISFRHILDRFHPGWSAHVCGPTIRPSLWSWISPDVGSDGELFGHLGDVDNQPKHRVLAIGIGPGIGDWNWQWVLICTERRLPTIVFHREASISDGNCGFWEQCWWVIICQHNSPILILVHSGNTISYCFPPTSTNDRFWMGNPRSCFHHDGNSDGSNHVRQNERETLWKSPAIRPHCLARNSICFICLLIVLRLSCPIHPILLHSALQHRAQHYKPRLGLLPSSSGQRRHFSRPPGKSISLRLSAKGGKNHE